MLKQPLKSNFMKTMISLSLLILILFLKPAFAQDTTGMKRMPFQFSVITPIGTNGLNSWNCINHISINMYGAYSGGLDGFEASGFFNVLRSDMTGAQFAGFVNADLGKSTGAQFAGFTNYNKKTFKGAQFAGFANTITADAEGFQAAGFANVITGNTKGLQAAGFANYSKNNNTGQLAGFANVNYGNLSGIQAAGFANINTGKMDGLQVSGFLNMTKILDGLQVGFINVVDSLESGIPVGFMSIVRNGMHELSISSNETLYGVASFRLGTSRFYNIFSAGMSVRNDILLWGFGYGMGTQISLNDHFLLNIENEAFQLNEDAWETKRLNMLDKTQVLISWKVQEHIKIFAGPSFNIVVSDLDDDGNQLTSSNIPPFSIWKKTYSNHHQVVLYPGMTFGIRF